MRSKISFGYLAIGVFNSKPCSLATCSNILVVQESLVVLFPQGNMPPSLIVRLGLYVFDISISLIIPNPEHLGHAPSGALKENDAGVILG